MTDILDGCLGEDTARYKEIMDESNKLTEELLRMPFENSEDSRIFFGGNYSTEEYMTNAKLILDKINEMNEIRQKYGLPDIGGSFTDHLTGLKKTEDRLSELFG